MTLDPENPPKKSTKYIQIQGFADIDENGDFLYALGPNETDVFKLSKEARVSQQIFKKKLGGITLCFASALTDYTDELADFLKKSTKLLIEDLTDCPCAGGACPPCISPGQVPVTSGRQKTDPPFDFTTIIMVDGQIDGVIHYIPKL